MARESNVGKFALQFPSVLSGRRMNDDGLIPPGALHLADAVAKGLEATPRLRRAEVDKQLCRLWVQDMDLPPDDAAAVQATTPAIMPARRRTCQVSLAKAYPRTVRERGTVPFFSPTILRTVPVEKSGQSPTVLE